MHPDQQPGRLPGVTHFMSYQEPAVFNAAVLDFLAQSR